MNLSTQTLIAAQKYGDKIAVIDAESNESITYRELDNQVASVAGGLLEMGVKGGDALACFAPNSIDLVIFVWATLRIGAHIVTIRPGFKEETVKMIIEECNVKYTITEPTRASKVTSEKIMVGSLPRGKPYQQDTDDLIDGDEIATILYTSGTTGGPKGAVVTRNELIPSVLSHIEYVGLTSNDMSIAELPLAGGFVLRNQLLASCVVGASFIIANNIKHVLHCIETYPVTLLYQPPTYTQSLIDDVKLKYGDSLPYKDHKLRAAIISSDQLPVSVHIDFYATFGKYICEGIGMSEMGTYAYTPMYTLKTHDRYLGRAIKGINIRIHEPNHAGIGEIVLSGAAVSRRYVNRSDANAKTFINGERYSGDLGRLDDNGDLFLEGRMNNLISNGGLSIAPIEIESPLEKHPDIARAIVTKLPHNTFGEVPVAFLVLKKNHPVTITTHEQLFKFLSLSIDDDIIPEYFFIVQDFPLNGTGKIDRLELTKLAEELILANNYLSK